MKKYFNAILIILALLVFTVPSFACEKCLFTNPPGFAGEACLTTNPDDSGNAGCKSKNEYFIDADGCCDLLTRVTHTLQLTGEQQTQLAKMKTECELKNNKKSIVELKSKLKSECMSKINAMLTQQQKTKLKAVRARIRNNGC